MSTIKALGDIQVFFAKPADWDMPATPSTLSDVQVLMDTIKTTGIHLGSINSFQFDFDVPERYEPPLDIPQSMSFTFDLWQTPYQKRQTKRVFLQGLSIRPPRRANRRAHSKRVRA